MKHFVVVYSFSAPSNSVGYVVSYHRTAENAVAALDSFCEDFRRMNPNAYFKGGVYQVSRQYRKREYVYREYVIRDMLEVI